MAVKPVPLRYTVYTDGASRKDKRGGWGASIQLRGNDPIDLYGGAMGTTNNRMELTAVIEALWYIQTFLSKHPADVLIKSDSQYVVKGATDYIEAWERAGWRGSGNELLKNLDLWKELQLAIAGIFKVTFEWVKGHSNDAGNDRADELAGIGVPDKATN